MRFETRRAGAALRIAMNGITTGNVERTMIRPKSTSETRSTGSRTCLADRTSAPGMGIPAGHATCGGSR
jgi:hypothetical protein